GVRVRGHLLQEGGAALGADGGRQFRCAATLGAQGPQRQLQDPRVVGGQGEGGGHAASSPARRCRAQPNASSLWIAASLRKPSAMPGDRPASSAVAAQRKADSHSRPWWAIAAWTCSVVYVMSAPPAARGRRG